MPAAEPAVADGSTIVRQFGPPRSRPYEVMVPTSFPPHPVLAGFGLLHPAVPRCPPRNRPPGSRPWRSPRSRPYPPWPPVPPLPPDPDLAP